MIYKIVKVRSLHVPAFVSKGMYLTKCGEILVTRARITYEQANITCPECNHRPTWPSKDVQRTFNTTTIK